MSLATKTITTTVKPIESDQRFAAQAQTLRVLEHGLSAIEAELDALNIEWHLGHHKIAEDPQGRVRENKLRLNSRNAQLRARLTAHRAKVPAPKTEEPAAGELPSTVATALEIIRGSRPALRVNQKTLQKTLIEQLENDRDAIRSAIFVQAPIVDALRDELIAQRAMQDREAWRAIQLRKFRALQALAAIKDEENDFRKSRFDAGFAPWRSDLLPEYASRTMLVLGSERDWDSEISRMRKALEEAKIL
jgi:hypothetical protein